MARSLRSCASPRPFSAYYGKSGESNFNKLIFTETVAEGVTETVAEGVAETVAEGVEEEIAEGLSTTDEEGERVPLTARSLQLCAAFHSGVPYHPSGTGESNELPSPLLHSRAVQISNPWQANERNNIDHDGGRCPVRALLFRDRLCSCVMLAHDGGRVPVRLLLFRNRLCS